MRIEKILIANRGEIARRITRTCRRMGIETVAVFSDADEGMPFVREADQAVRIGPAPSTQSYLRIDRILDAARKTAAHAIHPGYGFLSENADLAAGCEQAGIVFIGPSSESVRVMGSKQEAKRIAASVGVPVVPGYAGEDQSDGALLGGVREVGFPALIKASAGGGGKGMRIVREGDDVSAAIESARREALSAFGDGTLLIEKYIERPRHVEIQIFGDAHGNVVHLFERECSIQRRHQKIIEESPSVALDAPLRARMGEAAVAIARAISYQNAGTVEFILGPDRAFYFLEVNTRLQVEHPVTEAITGLDLVREQIRVAQGERLSFVQSDLTMNGAAVEARLYAEDPANGFLPGSGRIVNFEAGLVDGADGIRVDSGIETGTEVSIHYDPMLAKIIAHAPTRGEALLKLKGYLRGLVVQGVKTNRALLMRILSHPELVAGRFDTHFLETFASEVVAPEANTENVAHAAIAATLASIVRNRQNALLPHVPTGYRLNRFVDERIDFEGPLGTLSVAYRPEGRGGFAMHAGDLHGRFVIRDAKPCGEALIIAYEDPNGIVRHARVAQSQFRVFVHTSDADVALVELPRFPDRASQPAAGGCTAPMPGKIVKVAVEKGQQITTGQLLVVLEAMKMEHSIKAPSDGVVAQIRTQLGDQVDAGAVLVVLE